MNFWKQHERLALLEAFDKGSNEELCRAILCARMDEKNIVKTEGTLSVKIADLTGRDPRRIREALEALHGSGFGDWAKGGSTFTVNPDHASKARQRPKYMGHHPQFSDEANSFITRFEITFPRPRFIKRDADMMRAMKKKIDVLAEQNEELMRKHDESLKRHEQTLMLLREILAGQNPGESKTKAERHLTLIDGGKE